MLSYNILVTCMGNWESFVRWILFCTFYRSKKYHKELTENSRKFWLAETHSKKMKARTEARKADQSPKKLNPVKPSRSVETCEYAALVEQFAMLFTVLLTHVLEICHVIHLYAIDFYHDDLSIIYRAMQSNHIYIYFLMMAPFPFDTTYMWYLSF